MEGSEKREKKKRIPTEHSMTAKCELQTTIECQSSYFNNEMGKKIKQSHANEYLRPGFTISRV